MALRTILKIDQLNRITLPKDFLERLNAEAGDNVEVFIDGSDIIFRALFSDVYFSHVRQIKKKIKELESEFLAISHYYEEEYVKAVNAHIQSLKNIFKEV